MVRDMFTHDSVNVNVENGHVFAKLSGEAGIVYERFFKKYLDIGMLGLEASNRLNDEKKWRYNWRFFLPHGISMVRHRTVQLLHFPPDYVLERDQDYLSAHTTLRWASLLEENGANPSETSLYQNIIDIAPIAAPSGDGALLDGVYFYYDEYIRKLLDLWTRTETNSIRPMVSFGGPVRTWLKVTCGLDLKVLSWGYLELTHEVRVPTLAANHPSFIYNAVKRLNDDPNTPEDERIGVAMRIMQQDLIAANWQVIMGRNPQADPKKTLELCEQNWFSPERKHRICVLTYIQAFNKSPDEAAALCAKLPSTKVGLVRPTSMESTWWFDQIIERLRVQIGPLDSEEPSDRF